MRITATERFNIRRTMQDIRADFRRVYVLEATLADCTACGFDELSQSALDSNCTTCDGTGKTISWTVTEIRTRIKVVDFIHLMGIGSISPGIEVGDVIVYIRNNDKDTLERCDLNDASYVKIEHDTSAYRVYGMTSDGVGQEDEVRVILRKTNVETRATGY